MYSEMCSDKELLRMLIIGVIMGACGLRLIQWECKSINELRRRK